MGESRVRDEEERAVMVETKSDVTCTPDTSMEESDHNTSMEEDDGEEGGELVGNEEGDVDEAVSQLIPTDVVEEMVSSSDTKAAGPIQSGEKLAALWEDRSLFTQEFSDRTLVEKQSNPTQGKDFSQVPGPRSEANLSTNASDGLQQVCAPSLETSFHSEVSGDEAGPSQELQVLN